MTRSTSAGDELRAKVQAELALNEVELTGKEELLLDQAAQTADHIASLDAILEAEGITVSTPKGTIVHPAMIERRLSLLLLARLLDSLDTEGKGDSTARSRHGQRAANKRWNNHVRSA